MPNRDILVDWPGRRDKALKTQTVPAKMGRMVCLLLGVGLWLGVKVRVYLLCLLRFCQACCCWHLSGEIDTALVKRKAPSREANPQPLT